MNASVIKSAAVQRGASLVMTLVILGVLMLLGISAVVVSNTQFKLAGNLQFQNLAMSDAESAMAYAENWVITNYNHAGFFSTVQAGLYPAGSTVDPLTMTWDDTTSIKVDANGNQRFVIELYSTGRTLPSNSIGQCNIYGMNAACPKVNLYRISARGVSRFGATKIVQSLYAVRVNK